MRRLALLALALACAAGLPALNLPLKTAAADPNSRESLLKECVDTMDSWAVGFAELSADGVSDGAASLTAALPRMWQQAFATGLTHVFDDQTRLLIAARIWRSLFEKAEEALSQAYQDRDLAWLQEKDTAASEKQAQAKIASAAARVAGLRALDPVLIPIAGGKPVTVVAAEGSDTGLFPAVPPGQQPPASLKSKLQVLVYGSLSEEQGYLILRLRAWDWLLDRQIWQDDWIIDPKTAQARVGDQLESLSAAVLGQARAGLEIKVEPKGALVTLLGAAAPAARSGRSAAASQTAGQTASQTAGQGLGQFPVAGAQASPAPSSAATPVPSPAASASQAPAAGTAEGKIILGQEPGGGSYRFLPPGEYLVEAVLDGYQTRREKLVLTGGTTRELEWVLEKRDQSFFTLQSDPAGAKIYYDNRYFGLTPAEVPVPEAATVLSLAKDGYRGTRVVVPADPPAALNAVLLRDLINWKDETRLRRNRMYDSLAALGFSILPPLFFSGLYNNIYSSIGSAGAAAAGVSQELYDRLGTIANVFYNLQFASLIVPAALAVNFAIDLKAYLDAADLASGR